MQRLANRERNEDLDSIWVRDKGPYKKLQAYLQMLLVDKKKLKDSKLWRDTNGWTPKG